MRLTVSDILKFSFQKFCSLCCCRSGGKREKTFQARKIHIYKKGEEKIMKELDCINIMTKLRQLDVLSHLILTAKQRYLLNFQKKNIIKEDYHRDKDDQ